MNAPLVSVVVPLYNKERYIQRCLLSVQQQEMPDFEALIVDDGSTDGSAAIVKPWLEDRRFRLIQQENAGVGAARNCGLRNATAPAVAFLDADDEWLPGHLQSIIDLARKFPTASFFATGYLSVYRNGFKVGCRIDRRSACLIVDYYRLASTGDPVHISAVAIRRSADTLGVVFSEGERWGEDQEFYVRLALTTPLAYDPSVSSIYHHDVQGNVMAEAVWRRELPLAARRLVELLKDDHVPLDLKSSAQHFLAWILAQHALTGIASGHKAEALYLLKQASGLTDQDKKKLNRLGTILRWVPQPVMRLLVRFSRSRWGLVLVAGPWAVIGGSDQPRSESRIQWNSQSHEGFQVQ